MSNGLWNDITQSYTHRLTIAAGSDESHALGTPLKIKTDEVFFAGAAGHITTDSGVPVFVAGFAGTDKNHTDAMPVFAKNGSADPSVAASDINAGGGITNVLVATGGFELQTTEFDTTQGVTYTPGTTRLTYAYGTEGVNVGKLTPIPAAAGTYKVVGIVAPKGRTTYQGVGVLHFYPVHGALVTVSS
jgi:hypothetical protein